MVLVPRSPTIGKDSAEQAQMESTTSSVGKVRETLLLPHPKRKS